MHTMRRLMRLVEDTLPGFPAITDALISELVRGILAFHMMTRDQYLEYWGVDPTADPDAAIHAYVKQRLYKMVDLLKERTDGESLNIQRGITVSNPNALNTEHLGIHWTLSEWSALPNGKVPPWLLLSAKVSLQAIDWSVSLPPLVEGEDEIRLPPNVPVSITHAEWYTAPNEATPMTQVVGKVLRT